MDESKSKNEKPKEVRRFSQDQYKMLKRCSDKKDMKEWNDWRKEHRKEDVLLEGADLQGFYLRGVLFNTRAGSPLCGEVHLGGANLDGSNLESANFNCSHLEGAHMYRAHLEYARFWSAHLEGAHLNEAYLEDAYLRSSYLKSTIFYHAYVKSTNFSAAIVDGGTSFWECRVNRHSAQTKGTDLTGVGLDNVRVDPGTKQLLEYNIRWRNWERWYKEHSQLTWLVKPFWLISDYGLSIVRIVATFFALAFVFANIYYHWGRIAPPGIVDNLFQVEKATGEFVAVAWWLIPLRTLYFSIVTMTTLGFGDMYANAQSIWGHILLSLQVILGYVLLGALVTRFAVLFTAGGPAGRFSD
jgi:uncharacterized protein YjbI with pentapeptide repeats